MASLVRGILSTIKEKGVGGFIKHLRDEGYTKCLSDGNLLSFIFNNSSLDTRLFNFVTTICEETISMEETDGGHILIAKGLIPVEVASMIQAEEGQTKLHNIGATLVGVDKFGNKYYEDLTAQHGRHRWVEYAKKSRYNASQVPPEWHGWLHRVTDRTGDQLLMLKPKRYGVEHRENFSGEGDELIYHSKGHALHPGQRNWTYYQSWEPTKR